jgi:hypothetical protein
MSNAGQVGSAIVGGIIGFVVSGFNPMGAIYGAQIGLLAGTALFPTQLPGVYGPRMEDLATTGAQLGGPVPIVYGTIAVPGTVIFLSCVEERSHTEEVGGKGAPEQTVTTYTYYQTIALGLCEGPISGVLRIWENGELKYDVRELQPGESAEQYADRIEMSNDYNAHFTLYLGTETQEADWTLESIMGANNVPAFRGLAYIVYHERQLRDEQARRHPQFRFEVFQGASVTEIIPPTMLSTPLDSYQIPFLVPYWYEQQYLIVDLSGAGPETEGIRIFDVMTNTETRQVTFGEIIGDYLNFQHITVNEDGWLFLWFFSDGNTIRLVRVDPFWFEERESIYLGGLSNVPQRVAVVRHFGSLETVDFAFTQSLFGHFTVRQIYPTLSLTVITEDYPDQEGMVVDGYRQGSTSYAYGLTWGAALSGTGPDCHIYELRITQEFDLFGIPYASPELTLIATLPPALFDPACTRLTGVTGLVFDEVDNTLIFGVRGNGPGAGTPVVEAFFKWDPGTGEIVWRSADLVIENYDDYSQMSRLRGGTFGVPQFFPTVALIDTRTGSHTIIDVSDGVGGFTGQAVYDSAHGTVIAFETLGGGPHVIFLDRRVPGAESIANIVSDICSRCGLAADEIDVTDLEDRNVSGYAVTRPAPGRGIIEPLRQVGFFDQVESDGKLHYPTRGAAIALTLTEEDLGAHYAEEQRPPLVTTTKTQDVELPRRVRLRYIAESRDYDPGDAPSPTRITSPAVNEVDIDAPVSITDDQAMQSAEVVWADAWGSRWAYQISLDISFLALDPADVIALPVDGRMHRARIVSIEDAAGFLRRLTLVRDDDGRYVSFAAADPPQRPRLTIIGYSATALVLLDLPPLRDVDNDAGVYAVAYPLDAHRTWSGAVIHRSADGGATFAQVGSVLSAGVVGRLRSALPPGLSTTWDHENVLEVHLLAGTLESRTEEAVMNGANAAAIGAHGRWEIVQFLNATQVADTVWQVSGLLRGRRATEHHIGSSLAEDLFVMLSVGGMVRLPLQTSEIGAARVYRAVTLGTSAAEASSVALAAQGEALRPFSPVHIHGHRSGGDLLIEWTRRGRLGQELRSGSDIPLSEETEAYEVDIIVPGSSPETAIRTLETSSTSATYTAAEQAADGFSGGDPIMVRVYQLSATVGRGTPGDAIL